MIKIVLVNPPLTLKERYGVLAKGGTSLPPLGLTIIAAVIRQHSIPVSILDAEVLGLSYQEALEQILSQEPDCVGFTAVTASIYHAARLSKMVKAARADIITIIGGPHLTAVPEETMRLFSEFDIGVVGEGESTIIKLLNAMENGTSVKDIPGIIHREKDELVKTGRAPLIEDLDSLPFDAWDLLPNFPFSYASSVHKLGRWPTTSLISSRGCPYNCRFCDNSMFGRKIRGYSTKRLIEMVEYLQNTYGVKDIFFNDDNFVVMEKRLLEFCHLIDEKKIDLTWGCYSRVDNIADMGLLKTMKRAGCWRISFGLESGSQEILDFYCKNEKLEQMEKVIGWTRRAGIRAKGFFMIGNFLETEDTLRKTIKFIKRLKLDDFHATFLTPLPGSAIYEMADQYGTFDKDWEKMSMWYPVFIPKGLTKEILEGYRKKAFVGFYLRPSIILGYLFSIRTFADIKKIFKGVGTLIDLMLSKIKRG